MVDVLEHDVDVEGQLGGVMRVHTLLLPFLSPLVDQVLKHALGALITVKRFELLHVEGSTLIQI